MFFSFFLNPRRRWFVNLVMTTYLLFLARYVPNVAEYTRSV